MDKDIHEELKNKITIKFKEKRRLESIPNTDCLRPRSIFIDILKLTAMLKIDRKSGNNFYNKSHRSKFIIFIICLSILSIFIIIRNFRDNLIFFYSPTEFLANKDNNKQVILKKIKIGGVVKTGSINKENNQQIYFIVTDFNQELTVKYRGILPDLFREGQGVVALGSFNENENIFMAYELLVKHDENYIPYEIKKTISGGYIKK